MEDIMNIDECTSISELVQGTTIKDVDDKFDSLYDKVAKTSDEEKAEEITVENKRSKTAVVTPVVRKKNLVDYEFSDSEEEETVDKVEVIKTPHPIKEPKTPKLKRYRTATPHAKKLLHLVRQNAFEQCYSNEEEHNDGPKKTTPCRSEDAGRYRFSFQNQKIKSCSICLT